MGERPGEVASERTGLLEQTTLDEQKHNETWGSTTPHPNDKLWGIPTTLEPHPDSSSAQDTPLPDAPSTAPAENNGWRTVEAKATQKKKMKAKETTSTAAISKQTPTTKNGGRGKNTHQPRQTTPSAKKTWAEVVKFFIYLLTHTRIQR
ncbi:hypothetical protein BZA77DRAFT_360936 [Pyronema omphalodes]|nr:hypothetical protein BZA77DRAFT_360936 [Pyronema omphalodes]